MTIIDLRRVTEVAEEVREDDGRRCRHHEHAFSLTMKRRSNEHVEARLATSGVDDDPQNPFSTELDVESMNIMWELHQLLDQAELDALIVAACTCTAPPGLDDEDGFGLNVVDDPEAHDRFMDRRDLEEFYRSMDGPNRQKYKKLLGV